ncbi:MAG: hypothetical protein QOJ19_35 [Acidimicrobiia bacterium]|jgi:hypothetical protein|nr:hypothetical protein [Acidimicrobiia bacterium]
MIAATIAALISVWTLVETRDTQAELQLQQQAQEGRVRLEQVRSTAYAAYVSAHRRLRDSFDQFIVERRIAQQLPEGRPAPGSPQAPDLGAFNAALDDVDLKYVEVGLVADTDAMRAAVAIHDSIDLIWRAIYDAMVDGNWTAERFDPLFDTARQSETDMLNAAREARGLHKFTFN